MTYDEASTTAIKKIIKEAGAIHGVMVNINRTKHRAPLNFIEEIENLFSVNLCFYIGEEMKVTKKG